MFQVQVTYLKRPSSLGHITYTQCLAYNDPATLTTAAAAVYPWLVFCCCPRFLFGLFLVLEFLALFVCFSNAYVPGIYQVFYTGSR